MRIPMVAVAFGVAAMALSACGDDDLDDASSVAATVAEPCDGLTIGDTMVRLPPAENTAAYMTISNESSEDVSLVSATTDLGETVELHETTADDDGVMAMQEVSGITVPAGGEAVLAPGGLHVMIMGLTRDVAEGEDVDLSLEFDNGCTTEVVAPVEVVAGGTSGEDG